MRRRLMALPALAVAWSLVTASPASAALIWNGDAVNGTDVFKTLECDSPGSLTAASSDGLTYWKMDKPSGLPRCEARGIRSS